MSSNQITGFFNRLEGSRKYAFGSMGVLGVANDSRIAGTFILRGQEAGAVVNVAPDWESYSYTKLDLSKDEDKAFFEAALAWDLELDGKKWVEGSGKSVSASVFLITSKVLTQPFYYSSSKRSGLYLFVRIIKCSVSSCLFTALLETLLLGGRDRKTQ